MFKVQGREMVRVVAFCSRISQERPEDSIDMTAVGVNEELRRFVNGALGGDLAPDSDIFAAGATSLLAMELVMFIERNYGIELDDADLDLEHFATIDAMTRLVERKINSTR